MTVDEYFNRIDAAYDSENIEDIEEKIKETVELSKEEFGTENGIYASMLAELGGFYKGQRRFDESIEYFEKSMEIIGKLYGLDSADYATGINNIAGTYRLMGDLDRAAEGFKKAMEIYEKTIGKKHILYSAAINNLALVHLDKKEPGEASKLLELCTEILKDNPDAIHEYATSLINAASVQYQVDKLDEAKENLLVAIKMYEDQIGTWSPHYHSAMNTLGLVLTKQGEFNKAREYFEKSAKAAKALYGEDHYEYKIAVENLEAIKDK